MTDTELEKQFLLIKWREPILIVVADGTKGFGCRFCIAHNGLRADEVAALPQSASEAVRHIGSAHRV